MRKIKLAYILAKHGHRSQFRKEQVNGAPMRYFEHVRRVSLILIDEMQIIDYDIIIAAICHDTFEDTEDITPELMEDSFGSDVVGMIKCLSKTPKEGYHKRLEKCSDWRVLAIKACDRLDNVRSLMVPGTSLEFRMKQVAETKEIYFPLLDKLVEMSPAIHRTAITKVCDEIKTRIYTAEMQNKVDALHQFAERLHRDV